MPQNPASGILYVEFALGVSPLIAILQFIIITAIAAAFARRIIGKRAHEYDTKAERLIFESAIGLGLLGLIIFALGAAQLFYLPVFLGLLVLMAAVSWRALSGVISDVRAGIRSLRSIKWNATAVVAALIFASIGILVLLRTLVPPSGDDWDSLAYHLAILKLFLRHHGIYYIQFASHSNFPFTWEMLYTLGLGMGSVSLAKLFHFGSAVLLIGAIYTSTRRHFSAASALLAALIAVGIPILAWEATTAYIDVATALYSFLAVYALLNYSSTRDRKWAVMAGVLVGIAAGTKMTALGMIGIAVVWILWPSKETTAPQRLKTALLFVGLAAVVAAPWYIKTFIYTGNPVYPFFFGTLGGRNWSDAAAEYYRTDQLKFGMGRDPLSFLMLPWNLTVRFIRFVDYGARLPREFYELPIAIGNPLFMLSSIGFSFLIATPIAIFAAFRKGKHRPLLVASFALIVMWFFMMQNTRYLLPALAIMIPAVAYAAEITKTQRIMAIIAGATAIYTVLVLFMLTGSSIPVAVGAMPAKTYLENTTDVYRVSQFINENTPKDSKVALLGETRGFYLDRDYVWADPMNNPAIPYDRMGSPTDLIGWLKVHGISYVIINKGTFPGMDQENVPAYARLVWSAMDRGMEEVYVSNDLDPSRAIVVYYLSR